jgi:hypothetical protein
LSAEIIAPPCAERPRGVKFAASSRALWKWSIAQKAERRPEGRRIFNKVVKAAVLKEPSPGAKKPDQ